MTMKTLLLGAAAGLVTVGAAQAADLPMTKAAAVEYVKVCSEFGTGFFYIPGTDTCLKIGGELRADYGYFEPHGPAHGGTGRATDTMEFFGRAQLGFDARTATDYGTLRSFVLLDAYFSGAGDHLGGITSGGNSAVGLDKAFIQLGGLTAGYAESFYAFYDNYGDTIFSGYYSGAAGTTPLLAYTATFGGGFAATLSLEDGRTGIHRAGVADLGGTLAQGGQTVPDVVGSLLYDTGPSGWGKAQLMAALHQDRSVHAAYDTKYGYAIGAGLEVNLPVAAGAYIALEADYAHGAAKYIGVGPTGFGGAGGVHTGFDAHEDGVPDDLDLSHGWSVAGEAGVNLTPSLQLIGFGSYVDYSAGSSVPAEFDFKGYTAGANLTYTVVKGLTVAGEVFYADQSFDGTGPDVHSWGGGLRVKRTF